MYILRTGKQSYLASATFSQIVISRLSLITLSYNMYVYFFAQFHQLFRYDTGFSLHWFCYMFFYRIVYVFPYWPYSPLISMYNCIFDPLFFHTSGNTRFEKRLLHRPTPLKIEIYIDYNVQNTVLAYHLIFGKG